MEKANTNTAAAWTPDLILNNGTECEIILKDKRNGYMVKTAAGKRIGRWINESEIAYHL